MNLRVLLLCAASLPVAACTTMPGGEVASAAADAPAISASAEVAPAPQREQLYDLFARTDAAYIARNPIAAFFRGPHRGR